LEGRRPEGGLMGCNCGSKAGTVKRSGPVGSVSAATGGRVAQGPSRRSRVAFFAVPPPEDKGSEEIRFSTIYEARMVAGARPGWRVEARRIAATE
jgi:hypothetical protein